MSRLAGGALDAETNVGVRGLNVLHAAAPGDAILIDSSLEVLGDPQKWNFKEISKEKARSIVEELNKISL